MGIPLLVVKRPPYKFSVWMTWGGYSEHKISTFRESEAKRWCDWLMSQRRDMNQQFEVRPGDYNPSWLAPRRSE